MPRISSELSAKIANMRLLCAVMIVFAHCGRPADKNSLPWWFFTLLADGIVRVAVPFFFVASGFFLARHLGVTGGWKSEITKRIKTLICPYFIWNTVMGVYLILICAIRNLVENNHVDVGTVLSKLEGALSWYGINPAENPVLGPFWFVRSLLLLVVVSPILLFLVRRVPWLVIVGCWLVACFVFPEYESVDVFRSVVLRHCFTPVGVAYFSFGMYVCTRQIQIRFSRRLFMGSLLILIIATAIKAWLRYSDTAFNFGIIEFSIPFMMYVLWCAVPSKTLPYNLQAYSFPIYTLHIFMILLMYSTSYFVSLGPNWNPVVAILWGTLGSISLAAALLRFAPRIYKIVFGGR